MNRNIVSGFIEVPQGVYMARIASPGGSVENRRIVVAR